MARMSHRHRRAALRVCIPLCLVQSVPSLLSLSGSALLVNPGAHESLISLDGSHEVLSVLADCHQHTTRQGVSMESLLAYLGAYVARHSAIMITEKGLKMRFQKDQVVLVIRQQLTDTWVHMRTITTLWESKGRGGGHSARGQIG